MMWWGQVLQGFDTVTIIFMQLLLISLAPFHRG